MPRAEVYRKSHSRMEDGKIVTYAKGEELDASDRELKAFSDRLRPKGTVAASSEKDVVASSEKGTTTDEATVDLARLTKSELIKVAEKLGVVASLSWSKSDIIFAIEEARNNKNSESEG